MFTMLTLVGIVQARRALQNALHISYATLKATAQLAIEPANEMFCEVKPDIQKAIGLQLAIEAPPAESSVSLPHLLTAVCGFAKNFEAGPDYEVSKFGEDAWFITSTDTADAMGVADGVGGWRNHGIDPGKFSTFLMSCCSQLVHERRFDVTMPAQLLSRSFYKLLEQNNPVVGSSTACVLTFDRATCTLHSANIGDSGFVIYRDGVIVCRSYEQQHYFNTPYQLSSPPRGHNLNVIEDSPECADMQQFPLQIGDVILLATDGVYDNVPEEMLLQILEDAAHETDAVRLQMTANCLAYLARTLSFNTEYESPFCLNASLHNIDAPGGKLDDITVLLATVVQ